MPSATLVHSLAVVAAPPQRANPGDSPMIAMFRHWAAQARHIQNNLKGDAQIDAGCDVENVIIDAMLNTPARDVLDIAALAWVALVSSCTNDCDNPATVDPTAGFPVAVKFQEVAAAMFPELLAIAKGEAA